MHMHRLEIESLKVESFSTSHSSVSQTVAAVPTVPSEASCNAWCTLAGLCESFFVCG